MDISEIKQFISTMEDLHTARVVEQLTDQDYYDDRFPVGISKPFHIVRTGSAARIIDNIVAHIESSNPQVFREPAKNTESARNSAAKVGRMLNLWAKALVPEITETVWNAALYGEGIFQLEFNSDAYEKETYQHIPEKLPILVSSISPIVTFTYPYDALLPNRVVKKFQIDRSLAQELYPEIVDPLSQGSKTEYIAYYDDKSKYIEVEGTAAEGGIKRNILGFCPFVHYYSGFGKRTHDGRPEALAVGRLRKLRGTLVQECEVISRIDSIIGLYANPIYQIRQVLADADQTGREELMNTVLGAGVTITEPYGWQGNIYVPDVATAQLFAHLSQIESRLGLESPSILSGVAASSRVSGRQEDIEYGHISKRFAKLVNNLERALEAVFARCLMILDTIPKALPITIRGEVIEKGKKYVKEEQITKEDIAGFYECHVKLNPDQSVEDDRNFMKYRMLVNEGRISWRRFLIEGCNLTEWEADEVIAETLAEAAIRDDPLMRSIRTQEALERMNATRYLRKLQQDKSMNQRMQQELQHYQPPEATGYRPTEVKNPMAYEQARQLLGGEIGNGIRRPALGEGDEGRY